MNNKPREDGHPPWVIRFCEYDGRRLALIDHIAAGCLRELVPPELLSYRYSVSTLEDPPLRQKLPCFRIGRAVDLFYGNVRSAAIAAFEAQERRLLGREA